MDSLPLLRRIAGPLILIFITAFTSFGQDIEEAFRLINRRQLDSAMVIGKKFLENNPNSPAAYFAIGRIHLRKADFSEAMLHLERSLSFPETPLHIQAWAQHDLALCYFYFERYADAKATLLRSIQLRATSNSTAAASSLYSLLGFSDVYADWTVKESDHFIFRFQNDDLVDVERFVMRKEATFEKINGFFKAKLPKKIDYYIWSQPSQADEILKRPLAFTEPSVCLTHSTRDNSLGHEMTHSISSHAVNVKRRHKLISEGVCVYFDQTSRNNLSSLRKITNQLVIKNIWSDSRHADDLIYPLGGELVKRLIEAHGREKFLRLLEDQSYENAMSIYGDSLLTIIADIEREVNIQTVR